MAKKQVPIRVSMELYEQMRRWSFDHGDVPFQHMMEDGLRLLMNPVEGISGTERAVLGRTLNLYRAAPEFVEKALGLVQEFVDARA